MIIKPITSQNIETFNNIVSHPLQSWEWGEFREKTEVKVIRLGIFEKEKPVSGFQITIHPIPYTPFNIGYLPKGDWPSEQMLDELIKIGKENNCIFIQLEPNALSDNKWKMENGKWKILLAAHPLFTKYTFVLDLTKSEEQLLKNMHPKMRYNIKVAKRHGVEVKEDNSEEAFETYWKLTEETTKRQKFYAHTKKYHQLQWQTFPHPKMEKGKWKMENSLTSHLFTAMYEGKILTTMLFFVFHDMLYYPYGASSSEHKNVMHSTLTMWEAIRWGKKMGLKKFDMWGALGPDPDPKDPWLGFHTFKQRFGGELVEFVGSYDLVINPLVYQLYKAADKLRWFYLKIKK